jgi:hypothetical protein
MNEKIAKAFKDELEKLGIAPALAAAGRAALHVAPLALGAVGGGGPKKPKIPVTGGVK